MRLEKLKNLVTAVSISAATILSAGQAQEERFSVSGAAFVQSSGVENPYYVLGKREVQELAYDAMKKPLTKAEIERRLAGSEIELKHLLATDVLRPTRNGRYTIAFEVRTIEDNRLLRNVSDRAGASFAQAILARRDEIDAILANYDLDGVDRGRVLMALIGCVMLDWDGLGVTAEENYRVLAEVKPNGDRYHMILRENAPDVSVRALYWGSHNNPVADYSIVTTTFGDHDQPQRAGFPDIKSRFRWNYFSEDVSEDLAKSISAALAKQLDEYDDIGARMMIALREGPVSEADLFEASEADGEDAKATLQLLKALLYVEETSDGYRSRIPIFTEARDAAMLTEFRALGKEIMRDWLAENYDDVKSNLQALEAYKAGIDYKILFTQIWHDLFGWANYHLTRSGYVYDPYGPNAEFVSFVPFIWEAPLDLWSGTGATEILAALKSQSDNQ